MKNTRFVLIFSGLSVVGMSLSSYTSILIAHFIEGNSYTDNFYYFFKQIKSSKSGWYTYMVIQAIHNIFSYLLPALIYLNFYEKSLLKESFRNPINKVQSLWLGLLSIITILPFNGFLIDLNQKLKLPETFSTVEQWMSSKEELIEEITLFMLNIDSFHKAIILLFVTSVLASLGEEFFFRGVIQQKLIEFIKNRHVGVLLSAAFFSAVHIQFFGFLPRFVLGAIFGYLYLWTGNIWVSIFAHFINNSVVVLSSLVEKSENFTQSNYLLLSQTTVLIICSLGISMYILIRFKTSNRPNNL